MTKLERISITIDSKLLAQFDKQIKNEGFASRSEALTQLAREKVVLRHWKDNKEVAGAITLIYDHHKADVSRKLTRIQHDFSTAVITTQHVHLDHDHCLEVIIVREKAKTIYALVNALKTCKGIKHCSLMMSALGKNI